MKTAGFTDYSFTTDMGKYYKHFRDNIGSSVAVHGIAPQVWAAFDKVLFKKGGKKVHYKKPGEVNSVQGYSRTGKSGGTEIMFRGPYIEWKGLKLPLKVSPDNAYETDMLQRRVKLVRLSAGPAKRRDRWYAQLVLEGKPAIKADPVTGKAVRPIGSGPVGLDIGRKHWRIPPPGWPDSSNWQIGYRTSSRKSAACSEKWTGAEGQPTRITMPRTARSGAVSS